MLRTQLVSVQGRDILAWGILPLFDDISQNLHHGNSLFFGEALILESLYKLQSVKMMVPLLTCCGRKLSLRMNLLSTNEASFLCTSS